MRALLIGSPVHDESMRDDHFFQIALIMSGDTEEVQIMPFLVIGNLEQEGADSAVRKTFGFDKKKKKTCAKDSFKVKPRAAQSPKATCLPPLAFKKGHVLNVHCN